MGKRLVIALLTCMLLSGHVKAYTVPYSTSRGEYLGIFKITAYCSCYECSEGYGDMTSTGVRASSDRTIAVDPNYIPYGSRIIINGKEYIAEDCGGGVKGKHIDVYVNDHGETMRHGVRFCAVRIIKGDKQ